MNTLKSKKENFILTGRNISKAGKGGKLLFAAIVFRLFI